MLTTKEKVKELEQHWPDLLPSQKTGVVLYYISRFCWYIAAILLILLLIIHLIRLHV